MPGVWASLLKTTNRRGSLMDEWPPPPLAASISFREECWALIGPSGQPVSCWIEHLARGFEVRAEYTDERDRGLVETRWEPALAPASVFAEQLRARLLRDGDFREIAEKDS